MREMRKAKGGNDESCVNDLKWSGVVTGRQLNREDSFGDGPSSPVTNLEVKLRAKHSVLLVKFRVQTMVHSARFVHRIFFLAVAASLWPRNVIFTTAQANSSTTRLSLAASNPFRMFLSPTLFELDFVALSIVEEAMAKAILVSTDSLVDITINVNQMVLLSTTDLNKDELVEGAATALGSEGEATTVMKFFAVGTFLLKAPSNSTGTNLAGSLAQVSALDDVIERTFRQENSAAFVELLRNSGDPLLDRIQDVAVIKTSSDTPLPGDNPTNSATTGADEPKDGGPPLTTLDIILISVSVSIFLGIVYMIFQHHKDRGYIESQRHQTLNSYRRNNETSPGYPVRLSDGHHATLDAASSTSGESSKTSVVNNCQPQLEEQPSNASPIFTSSEDHSFATTFSLPPSQTDINTHLNSRRHRYTSKLRLMSENASETRSLPAPTKKAMTSASSVMSLDDECKSTGALSFTAFSAVLSSDFGPINWFRKSTSKGVSALIPDANIQETLEEGPEEGSAATSKNSTTSSCSTGSEDVFQVGNVTVNVIATGSVAASDAVSSKASSSIVTEWMKTIQVISSTDSKAGSEASVKASSSSSDQSSTAENSSAEAPSVEGSESDDIVSLEQSMANSVASSIANSVGNSKAHSVTNSESNSKANSRGVAVGIEEGSTMEF
jgi:hypothetical protein